VDELGKVGSESHDGSDERPVRIEIE